MFWIEKNEKSAWNIKNENCEQLSFLQSEGTFDTFLKLLSNVNDK